MPNLDLRPQALNLLTYYKGDYTIRFTFTDGGSAYPLTDVTAASFIIYEKNGTAALTLSSGSGLTVNGAGGYVDLALTNAQVVDLYSQEYNFEFLLTLTGGTVWPIADGVFIVSEDGQTSVSLSDISLSVENSTVEISVIAPAMDLTPGHEIQDEGTPLTQRGALNFVGAGVTVTDDSGNDRTTVTISGGGGGGTWGSITGTLSDQTDLQTALDGKVDENAAITGATKTKITYDAKGLVTAGADATTADINDSTDRRYVTDAQQTVIGNTSGTNTGDQTITLTGDVTGSGTGSFAATIAGDAVTNTKAANMAAWTVKGRNNAASGDPQDIGVADLTEEASPAAGDMLFGWESGGALRKFDIGNLPGGGGGGASYTEITYAAMQTAITNATLTPGGWYLITDAAGTDLGFLTYAVTENQISVAGVGGYLNADFQAVGNYDGVEAITGIAAGTRQGVWRTSFEAITISYVNLQFPADYVSYSTSSGLLDPAETFTTDLGTTGEVITDDGAGTVTVQNLSQALVAGEVITGDNSGNTVTVDSYTVTAKVFAVGDTITGGTTGATAVILTDDGVSTMTAYMTSAGVSFNGSEVLDNGNGVTADQDGAASSPTIVLGDVVIWNLLHFQLTDDTLLDGTDPATNTAAYTQLLKTDADQGYITARDVSEFNFPTQIITLRKDLLGNSIQNREGDVQYFQFGDERKRDNTTVGGKIDCINSIARIRSNVVYNGGAINGNTNSIYETVISGNTIFGGGISEPNAGGDQIEITDNFLQGGSSIGLPELCGGGVLVKYNTLGPSSQIGFDALGANCEIQNNILENGASLTGITAGSNCSISRNKIGQGATLGGSTTMGDGAAFDDLDIRANKQVSNKELDAGVTFSDKIVQLTTDEAETYSANVEGNRTQPGFSDIPGTIDITGLTALDCTAAFAQYRGIYNLTSSNATESIDTITNPPTAFPFIIRPDDALTMTITGTAYSGVAAGQIALKAASYVLDGSKGEYIVLEIDPLGTGALIEKQVVNGLI